MHFSVPMICLMIVLQVLLISSQSFADDPDSDVALVQPAGDKVEGRMGEKKKKGKKGGKGGGVKVMRMGGGGKKKGGKKGKKKHG